MVTILGVLFFFLMVQFGFTMCPKDSAGMAISVDSFNTKLNDFRKIMKLRKSENDVIRISFCNVTENLAEYGMHCLPCSYINGVIKMLP